jgi:hypothetical protein
MRVIIVDEASTTSAPIADDAILSVRNGNRIQACGAPTETIVMGCQSVS